MDESSSNERALLACYLPHTHSKGHHVAALSAALALLILALSVLALYGCAQPTALLTGTPTTRPGWRVYQNSGSYFTIQIPSTWQAAVTQGSGVQGTKAGASRTTTVDTAFRGPAGADPSARLFVSVTYTTFANATVGQQILCGAYKEANTTLAGHRAEVLPGVPHNQMWTISTKAALYQVAYGVPADFDNTLKTTLPTPVPEATTAARQSEAGAIIATFVPIPAQPPQC